MRRLVILLALVAMAGTFVFVVVERHLDTDAVPMPDGLSSERVTEHCRLSARLPAKPTYEDWQRFFACADAQLAQRRR